MRRRTRESAHRPASEWGANAKRQHDNPKPLLVDAHAAAILLGVSPRTISALTSSGELPSVLIRRRRLYALRDIEAFIEARREGGGE